MIFYFCSKFLSIQKDDVFVSCKDGSKISEKNCSAFPSTLTSSKETKDETHFSFFNKKEKKTFWTNSPNALNGLA
jgi:hypothetical protein